ncbi:hypothetical protein OSTOST_22204, partial [Ostertagia ostertagi]
MLILGLKGPPWKSVQEHGRCNLAACQPALRLEQPSMRITPVLGLRRIINSAYHPFQTIPKPDRWHTRERLSRFTAWQYAGVRTCYKHGTIKLNKLFWYLDMQRQDEKRLELFVSHSTEIAEHLVMNTAQRAGSEWLRRRSKLE